MNNFCPSVIRYVLKVEKRDDDPVVPWRKLMEYLKDNGFAILEVDREEL